MKRILFITFLSLLIWTTGHAGSGITGPAFLNIEPSPEAVGMGSAFTAASYDISGIFWNPAGIGSAAQPKLFTTYMFYIQDCNYGFVGYSVPVGTIGNLGFSVSGIRIPGIEIRTSNTEQPDATKDFYYASAGITYANSLPPYLDFGVTLKGIYGRFDSYSGYSIAVDAGGIYSVLQNLKAGLSVSNLGMPMRFISQPDNLPINVRAGIMYEPIPQMTKLSSDFILFIYENKYFVNFGFEFKPLRFIAFRAGYKLGTDLGILSGLTLGAGFYVFNTSIDYAFVPYGDLGNTHRISLGVGF